MMDIIKLLPTLVVISLCNGIPFRIGIGGGIETQGSLLQMVNQTISLSDIDLNVIIDFPSYVSCSSLQYGNTTTLFCPDSYLYYRWQHLFIKLIQKHSYITIINIENVNEILTSKEQSITFTCPDNGTVLSYGDSHCEITLPNGMIKPKHDTGQCHRLVPFILPSFSKVTFRQISYANGKDDWNNVFLPCVAPLYICGYGSNSTIHSIQYNEALMAVEPPPPGFLGFNYVVRDAKYDCLMGQEFMATFQNIWTCIFYVPSHNISDFQLRLNKLMVNEMDASACMDISVCSGSLIKDRNFCGDQGSEEIIAIDHDYFNPFASTDMFFFPEATTNSMEMTSFSEHKPPRSGNSRVKYLRSYYNQDGNFSSSIENFLQKIASEHNRFLIIFIVIFILLLVFSILIIVFVLYYYRLFKKYQLLHPLKSTYQNIDISTSVRTYRDDAIESPQLVIDDDEDDNANQQNDDDSFIYGDIEPY